MNSQKHLRNLDITKYDTIFFRTSNSDFKDASSYSSQSSRLSKQLKENKDQYGNARHGHKPQTNPYDSAPRAYGPRSDHYDHPREVTNPHIYSGRLPVRSSYSGSYNPVYDGDESSASIGHTPRFLYRKDMPYYHWTRIHRQLFRRFLFKCNCNVVLITIHLRKLIPLVHFSKKKYQAVPHIFLTNKLLSDLFKSWMKHIIS